MILAYTPVSPSMGVALETGTSRFGDENWFFEQIRLHGKVLQEVARAYAGTPDIIQAHREAMRKQHEAVEAVFQEVICMSRLTSPCEEDPTDADSSIGMRSDMSELSSPDPDPTIDETIRGSLDPSSSLGSSDSSDGNTDGFSLKNTRSDGKENKRRRTTPRAHQCPNCEKTFTRRWNLRTHLLTHEVGRDRPFQCRICLKQFYRVHDLDRHQGCHGREKTQHCSCGKSFFRKDALRRHIVTDWSIPIDITKHDDHVAIP